MSITSLDFCFFFFLIYLVYWSLKNHVIIQNLLILVSSYLFYSLIDWCFSFLLLFISILSYLAGLILNKNVDKKITRLVVYSTVFVNIGILFLFKYYDFFTSEFASLFDMDPEKAMLHLVLPVGISFYTFTATGYIIDVYKGKVVACNKIIPFMSFISFFPLLLSGPIERSNGLLVQFKKIREFKYSASVEGVQQVVWGAFKKLVVADNCASIVNIVFSNYEDLPASSLVIGGVLYSIQIYFDFSGYSDMAIGLSKLLGFNIRRNFNYPYFSLNVSDFWRRWHMSLQSWLTDYIYFPLGGSRCSKKRTIVNTFVVFVVCGIWHGANWTFIVWGLYHAVLFIPLLVLFSREFKKRTVDDECLIPSFSSLLLMISTFILITIGWIIFNSPSLTDSIGFLTGIFSLSIFEVPIGIGLEENKYILLLLILVFLLEWIFRHKEIPLFFNAPGWVKVSILYILLGHILLCSASQSDFIYYQF